MFNIYQNEDEIIFEEKMPNGIRIFLSIVGLIPIFIAPYELLIKPSWHGFSIALLLAVLMLGIAILIGGLFLVAGIFGLNQTLKFSTQSKSVYYSYKSSLFPIRSKIYQFIDIKIFEIITHDWTDGPSTYGLQFIFNDSKKIEIGSFAKKSEAEECLNKLEKLIQEKHI